MAASEFVKAVDRVQRAIRPSLKEHGFKSRGRTFNRLTSDGLTQVVNLQMGPSDPPVTTYIPGLRENLYGLFTINLGVYIPEVAELKSSGLARSWVQEYYCSIRTRLGQASGSSQDLWWHARDPVNARRRQRVTVERLTRTDGNRVLLRIDADDIKGNA